MSHVQNRLNDRALSGDFFFVVLRRRGGSSDTLRVLPLSQTTKGKPLKLRHYDISRAHFQGSLFTLNFTQRIVKTMVKTTLTDGSRACTELKILPTSGNFLICGEWRGFRRGKHSAALFHNPNQVVRMAVRGDDSVCLSDDDGLKHIDKLLKSKYTAKDMGTLGFGESDAKILLFLNLDSSWTLNLT